MSRAFVNEDNHHEIPFVPPRADLPPGIPNYVTPAGMDALLKEKESLLVELKNTMAGNERDNPGAVAVLNIKLQMLENRITSAQVINNEDSISDVIRFGSIIKLDIGDKKQIQEFQIVGVDEANLKEGKIAFISPLARLLLNKKTGDSVTLQLPRGNRTFKIISFR